MTEKIDYKKWHSGPPPSVGWWPASAFRTSTLLRWWDGKRWSEAVGENCSAWYAGMKSKRKTVMSTEKIEWQHRPASWPARSRT